MPLATCSESADPMTSHLVGAECLSPLPVPPQLAMHLPVDGGPSPVANLSSVQVGH